MMFNSSFNQNYSIKHIIYLFQQLSRFLDFELYLFCRLENAPEAIGLCGSMSSFGVNSPKQIRVQQSHIFRRRHVAKRKNNPDSSIVIEF